MIQCRYWWRRTIYNNRNKSRRWGWESGYVNRNGHRPAFSTSGGDLNIYIGSMIVANDREKDGGLSIKLSDFTSTDNYISFTAADGQQRIKIRDEACNGKPNDSDENNVTTTNSISADWRTMTTASGKHGGRRGRATVWWYVAREKQD